MGGGGGAAVITVLVPPGVGAGAARRERLDEAEQHHLRVRRARDGRARWRSGTAPGSSARAAGSRSSAKRGRWRSRPPSGARGRPELTLAVGAGDRERFGWLVEKAVELGATRIVPLETERTGGVATRRP